MDALADGVVTDQEIATLRLEQQRVALPPEEIRAVHARLAGELLEVVTEDDAVSAAEVTGVRELFLALRHLGWAPGEEVESRWARCVVTPLQQTRCHDDTHRGSPSHAFQVRFQGRSNLPQQVVEGTGAMRAYEAMMYGVERDDQETRAKWRTLLEQYCALDTLAMALIWEYWERCVQV